MYVPDAPDFPPRPGQRRPYPSGGAKLGPAWRIMWARMYNAGPNWTDGVQLARDAAVTHVLNEYTLRNLLNAAANAGLIEHRNHLGESRPEALRPGKRMRAQYRLIKEGGWR